MASPILRITSGPGAGKTLPIDRELVIGREAGDLELDDPELSRRHVALRPARNGVEIEDLGSLNGTYVGGRRISAPEVLTVTTSVKMGTSEGNIELPRPEVTRPAPVAQPDATVQSPVAAPNVTAPRRVAEPDVTAARPIADPDVTAQRPVADPDVTLRRPLAAGPPGGTEPPPKQPAEEEGGGGGGKLPLLIGLVVAAGAVIAVAVALASGGGDDTRKRTVDVRMNLSTRTARDERLSELPPGSKPIRWTLTGRATGEPFGPGAATVLVTLQPIPKPPPNAPPGPPPGGKPKSATVTPRFDVRFEGGSLVATERLSTTRVGAGIDFKGTGRILDGTGEFENATGSFEVTGGRPKFNEPAERIRWRGTVEY